MPAPSFDLPPDFDGEVRLFPLPNLVIFPSNVLPLHIFESRYREMLEDAIQGDHLITMATLVPGFEHDYYSRPAIAPTVCIGRVVAHEKTEQGTYSLVLVAIRRAQVEYEIEPVRAFRRARIKLIDERESNPDELGRKLGEQLASRIRDTLPSAEELIEDYTRNRITLALLTDVVAFHLPLATDLKLQLLAEGDVLKRTRLLLANLPAANSTPRRTRRYPHDFSSN